MKKIIIGLIIAIYSSIAIAGGNHHHKRHNHHRHYSYGYNTAPILGGIIIGSILFGSNNYYTPPTQYYTDQFGNIYDQYGNFRCAGIPIRNEYGVIVGYRQSC